MEDAEQIIRQAEHRVAAAACHPFADLAKNRRTDRNPLPGDHVVNCEKLLQQPSSITLTRPSFLLVPFSNLSGLFSLYCDSVPVKMSGREYPLNIRMDERRNIDTDNHPKLGS